MSAAADLVTPIASVGVRPRPWLRLVEDSPARQPFVQGTLLLTYTLPGGLVADPSVGDDAPDPEEIPPVDAWASQFLQALIEVTASKRPLSQLARWTAPPVYAHIARVREHVADRHREVGRRPARQHIASVHTCQLSSTIAEVAARVAGGRRSRALAARLEFRRGRWTCTALTFG